MYSEENANVISGCPMFTFGTARMQLAQCGPAYCFLNAGVVIRARIVARYSCRKNNVVVARIIV